MSTLTLATPTLFGGLSKLELMKRARRITEMQHFSQFTLALSLQRSDGLH